MEHLVKQRKLEAAESKKDNQIRKDIINKTRIVCSTLAVTGSSLFSLAKCNFDTVIIDEAGQSLESLMLVPLQYKCQRLILLGDPKQLPATVFSSTCKELGYGLSLFERLQMARYPSVLLNEQYRMNPLISSLISKTFYNSQIKDSVGNHKENDFKIFPPLWVFDIKGNEEKKTTSFENKEEALFIAYLLEMWLKTNSIPKRKTRKTVNKKFDFSTEFTPDFAIKDLEKVVKQKIGVISPYSGQSILLKTILKPLIDQDIVEVNTIDGFQGREKGIFLIFRFNHVFDCKIQ